MRIDVEVNEEISEAISRLTAAVAKGYGLETKGHWVPIVQLHEVLPGDEKTRIVQLGPPDTRVDLTIKAVGSELTNASDSKRECCVAVAHRAFRMAYEGTPNAILGLVFLPDNQMEIFGISNNAPPDLPARLRGLADYFEHQEAELVEELRAVAVN